jgi:predicted site-specific integrase-resolvase
LLTAYIDLLYALLMTKHTTPATTRRAVGYVRVSTDKQADTGVLDAQAAKIKAMADVQDADLVEVSTDAGASAKTLQQPGLDGVFRMLRVVVATLRLH